MFEKTVKVVNKLGLHARPASLVVQIVSRYKSEVLLIKDTTTVNGKSIMSVMMLAAEKGSELTIRAEGKDEKEVVEALCRLVQEKFHED